MDKKDRNPDDSFMDRLLSFVNEDSVDSFEAAKSELRDSGIDPDKEIAWVNQFVAERIQSLSRKQIEQAASNRQKILEKLAIFKNRCTDQLKGEIAELMESLNSRSDKELQAFNAAYSKLENPTIEDLRAMLTDWIELGQWDQDHDRP